MSKLIGWRCVVVCGSLVSFAGCSSPVDASPAPQPIAFPSCANLHDALTSGAECSALDPISVDVKSCTTGLSLAQTEDALEIAVDFLASLRTLEDAAAKTNYLGSSASVALVSLARHPTVDAIPWGFQYEEGGAYVTPLFSGGSASMRAQFAFAKDYATTNKGQVIVPSLFRSESYLLGTQIALHDLSATINYQSTGPLAELLGHGTAPPNPLELSLFDPDELDLQFLTTVSSGDETTALGTAIHHVISITQPTFVLDEAETVVQLKSTATRGGQTLAITLSAMRASRSFGSLVRGNIGFTVTGQPVSFSGTVIYGKDSGVRQLALKCL